MWNCKSALLPMLIFIVVVSASAVKLAIIDKTNPIRPINTFSIVARDPESGAIGIAVASKYLAVGSVVPWAKATVGGIATQSYVNMTLGSSALELLSHGKSAQETLDEVLRGDPEKEWRQVGLVDSKGNSCAFTGKNCMKWAGSKQSRNIAVQGNFLTGPEVVEAMHNTFEKQSGELSIRLINALAAGEKTGGDKRGRQSAAILIVRANRGPNGLGDREIDLRVDDHPNPIQELARLMRLKGIAVKLD